MAVGLLIIRLYLGLNFLAYGGQKVFGLFGGPGLDGYSGFVGSLGLRPQRLMGYLGAFTELVAGLLLLVGFLTPVAAAGIIGQMIVAMALVHWENGYFNSDGGVTYNISLIAASLGLAFTGPGRWSLGRALDVSFQGSWSGLAALGLGIVGAVVVLATQDTREAAEA